MIIIVYLIICGIKILPLNSCYSFYKVLLWGHYINRELTEIKNHKLWPLLFIHYEKHFVLNTKSRNSHLWSCLVVLFNLLGRFSWRQLSIHYKWSLSTLNTIIKCWWASQDQVLITWVAAGPKWPRRIRGSFLFYFCIKYPD